MSHVCVRARELYGLLFVFCWLLSGIWFKVFTMSDGVIIFLFLVFCAFFLKVWKENKDKPLEHYRDKEDAKKQIRKFFDNNDSMSGG